MDNIEEVKNYAAKWFDKGREHGNAPITKDMLSELEREGEEICQLFSVDDKDLREKILRGHIIAYEEAWAGKSTFGGKQADKARDQLLALIPPVKLRRLTDDTRNCLDCAREAIVDAICCEDGLDGGAGEKVIKWITDILGDYDEWIKTHSEVE